jgi:hypothetical protein
MTIRPPKAEGRLGRVEVLSLVEMSDRVRGESGAGRDDELVISQGPSVGERHDPIVRVDASDGAHDEPDRIVQERALRTMKMLHALAPHREVHEAWLIHMVARLVDDRHLGRPNHDPTAQAASEEVGGEGSPNAAAQDQDAVHGLPPQWVFSTVISSKPSRAVTPINRWPAFSTHFGMSVRLPVSEL